MYKIKSIGPSTEPCGTPKRSKSPSDIAVPILTDWERLVMYDFIHSSTVPVMPNFISSTVNSFSWSMVSNAADKSRSSNAPPPSASTPRSKSFMNLMGP